MTFENHQYYNCSVTTTVDTYTINANWIHNQDLDYFYHWQCAAGQLRLYIDRNLDVWSGECKNQHLGHALKGFDLLTTAGSCEQARCSGCTDDLIVAKQETVVKAQIA